MTDIKFNILEIDPLGQGVSKSELSEVSELGKLSRQIYFVPKTLPGETGTAEVYKSARGVHFCRLTELENKSADRIESECPHFGDCPGCHFLHTDYENELQFKKQALMKIFRKSGINEEQITIVPAKNRLGYRNRMQLHYDNDENALGFFSTSLKQIIEVPECLIANEAVTKKLHELYEKEAWRKLVKGRKKGHIEIYEREELEERDGREGRDGGKKIFVAVDKDYAEGGFTQVNEEMNDELVRTVGEAVTNDSAIIIDLFGGNGNLTQNLNAKKIYSVDTEVPQNKLGAAKFVSLDLFSDRALENFSGQTNLFSCDTLLLDPPRSGFKFLQDWVTMFRPAQIIYTSCDPHTLERDLQTISAEYEIEKIFLLDLFPSTYHFETVAILNKK